MGGKGKGSPLSSVVARDRKKRKVESEGGRVGTPACLRRGGTKKREGALIGKVRTW